MINYKDPQIGAHSMGIVPLMQLWINLCCTQSLILPHDGSYDFSQFSDKEFSHWSICTRLDWNCAKSFQTLTSSHQHIKFNIFPHTTTTTVQPPSATIECPGQCPYVGQPRASLSTSIIPCTTPPPLCSSTNVACPSNHTEDSNNELGGLKESEESG